jgi:hypothetical protein
MSTDLLNFDPAFYKFMPGADTKGQSPFSLPAVYVEASEVDHPAMPEAQGKELTIVNIPPEPKAAKSDGLLSSKHPIEPVAQPGIAHSAAVQPPTVQAAAIPSAVAQPDASMPSSMSSMLHFSLFSVAAISVVLLALNILRRAKGRKSS